MADSWSGRKLPDGPRRRAAAGACGVPAASEACRLVDGRWPRLRKPAATATMSSWMRSAIESMSAAARGSWTSSRSRTRDFDVPTTLRLCRAPEPHCSCRRWIACFLPCGRRRVSQRQYGSMLQDSDVAWRPTGSGSLAQGGRAGAGPYKDGPGAINVFVTVGGMPVQPGDIVVGDQDGIVAMSPEEAPAVIEKARAQHAAEEATIRAIREGRWDRSFVDALEARCQN